MAMLFLLAIFLTAGMFLAGVPETAGVLIFGLTLIGAATTAASNDKQGLTAPEGDNRK